MAPAATPATEEGASSSATPARRLLHYQPHRLTIDRYLQMIEAGVFCSKEPIFLWHGSLVEKMTKGRPHTIALLSLSKLLESLIPPGWYSQQEQPIAIRDDGMPEPDITVVRGTLRDHTERAPTAQETALVIEVADSSLLVDAREVLVAYAREAIPVYWLVNLPHRRVEVYTDPTGPEEVPAYRSRRDFGPDDDVPVILDGREVGRVNVRDVLP